MRKIKITELTDKQKAKMPEFVDKWIKIGLNTKPADRKTAEKGIHEVYKSAGLESPKKIVWCTSPIVALLTIAVLKQLKQKLGATVRATVRDTVRATVRDTVGDTVWDTVRATVWDTVRATVGATVGDTVWDTVWDTWRELNIWGQHDAGWLAFYDYMRNGLGLIEETEPLQGLSKVAKSANWWWAYQNIVFICDRPKVVAFDENNRLHRTDGAAIEYRDGWGVHCWHGVRVPYWVIEHPEQITIDRINTESNVELRRVLIERYGYERFVKDSNSTLLDDDSVHGKLYRTPRGSGLPPITTLHVKNSTPEPDGSIKDYIIRVKPDIATAHQAQEWINLPDEMIGKGLFKRETKAFVIET